MKTSKCNKTCPDCGNHCIFYGKVSKDTQRYKCKKCNLIFSEERNIKMGRRGRKLISLLLQLLSCDFYNQLELEAAIKAASYDKSPLDINLIRFSTQLKTNKPDNENLEFDCKNPKLLICVDKNDIIFYKIPKTDLEKRTITITENRNKYISPKDCIGFTSYVNRGKN